MQSSLVFSSVISRKYWQLPIEPCCIGLHKSIKTISSGFIALDSVSQDGDPLIFLIRYPLHRSISHLHVSWMTVLLFWWDILRICFYHHVQEVDATDQDHSCPLPMQSLTRPHWYMLCQHDKPYCTLEQMCIPSLPASHVLYHQQGKPANPWCINTKLFSQSETCSMLLMLKVNLPGCLGAATSTVLVPVLAAKSHSPVAIPIAWSPHGIFWYVLKEDRNGVIWWVQPLLRIYMIVKAASCSYESTASVTNTQSATSCIAHI